VAGPLRGALIDQAVNAAASVALGAALYVALRPEVRPELAAWAADALRSISGDERRAWLSSPKAEFARRSRERFIEQEWSVAPLEADVP
jgi:hypothetical protein